VSLQCIRGECGTFLNGVIAVAVVDEGQEVLNSYRLAFGHMVDVEEEVDGEISSALLIVSVCIKPDEPYCGGGGGEDQLGFVKAG